MRNWAIRFLGLAAAGVVSASLALGAPAPAGADTGSSKPPPIDRSQTKAERGQQAQAQDRARQYRRNPLLKELLSEEDEGGAQPEAPPAALCQRFLNAPNPYANPFPNVDQIRRDGIGRNGAQAGCSTPQNETTIAVNPQNPRNLVAGANDYRLFNSRESRNDSSTRSTTATSRSAEPTQLREVPSRRAPSPSTSPTTVG
jgi:hypothetical protein